jgi:AcrR family transcriptional regulator
MGATALADLVFVVFIPAVMKVGASLRNSSRGRLLSLKSRTAGAPVGHRKIGLTTTTQRKGRGRVGQPRGGASKEDRLDDVIEVATRLFRQRGFRGTRLDDISDELRVTRAALYYYFDSKLEVLEEVCTRAFEAAEATFGQLDAIEDPFERFRRFARGYAENVTSDAARVYFRDSAQLPPRLRRALAGRAEAIIELAEQTLRYGVRVGAFREDLEVHVAALGFCGMLNQLAEWHRPERDGQLLDIVDSLVDIFVMGVAAPTDRAGRKTLLARQ